MNVDEGELVKCLFSALGKSAVLEEMVGHVAVTLVIKVVSRACWPPCRPANTDSFSGTS